MALFYSIFTIRHGNEIKNHFIHAFLSQVKGHGMGQFRQISTFVEVVAKGSLSAAARAEGIAPAMIGRRLDALEQRLGVKLLQRTTR